MFWAALIMGCGSCVRTNDDSEALYDAFVDTFADGMAAYGTPGVAWVFVKEGVVVGSGSMGLAKVGETIPASEYHIWPLASVTKVFMGIATVRHLSDGQLGLDTTFKDATGLDWSNPKDDPGIEPSLLNFATHTSGLVSGICQSDTMYDLSTTQVDPWIHSDRWAFTQLWRCLQANAGSDVFSRPSSDLRWQYSNIGVGAVLGAMMEAQYGFNTPAAEIIYNDVLLPLNLTSALLNYAPGPLFDTTIVVDPYSAVHHHDTDASGDVVSIGYDIMGPSLSGGMAMSAWDLARVLQAVTNGGTDPINGYQLLSESELGMLTSAAIGDAGGDAAARKWAVVWEPIRITLTNTSTGAQTSRWVYGHGGTLIGAAARFAYDPGTQSGVVYLTNLGGEVVSSSTGSRWDFWMDNNVLPAAFAWLDSIEVESFDE